MLQKMFDAFTNLFLQDINAVEQPTPNRGHVPHRQARRQTPPPGGHLQLIPLISVLHPQRDEAIQHPIPLQMQNPLVVLETSSLNGDPPQEVLVVKVEHGVVNITRPLTIQMINDGGVLGIFVKDVAVRVGIVSLVCTRDRYLMDTVGVLSDSRHGDR